MLELCAFCLVGLGVRLCFFVFLHGMACGLRFVGFVSLCLGCWLLLSWFFIVFFAGAVVLGAFCFYLGSGCRWLSGFSHSSVGCFSFVFSFFCLLWPMWFFILLLFGLLAFSVRVVCFGIFFYWFAGCVFFALGSYHLFRVFCRIVFCLLFVFCFAFFCFRCA